MRARFDHGLGDCVYFSHQLPLYMRRGWRIEVQCNSDKEILFRAAGASGCADPDAVPSVPWWEGDSPTAEVRFDNYWRWSKMARNLSLEPMPDIGRAACLWPEYCDVSLSTWPFIPPAAKEALRRYVDTLNRPLILLHTHGTTNGERKNLPPDAVRNICRDLLAATEGTILLLDWDGNLPPVPHWRIRHARYDFGHLGTAELLALLELADLMVGIDSGPLHACRFTNTPAIGIWMRNSSPATWSLPRSMQVNVVSGCDGAGWRKELRLPFNLLECGDPSLLAPLIGRTAGRMLAGCRYLPLHFLGRDILLQQSVGAWQRGNDNGFGGFDDRDRGFDWLLRAACGFERPLVVQNGSDACLLLGTFAASREGELIAIDDRPAACALARESVACLGGAVQVVEWNSADWLSGNRRSIDILYFDRDDIHSDMHSPGCAERGLLETQAAYHQLHSESIVAWDNTCYQNGAFIGAGELAVPWLVEQGWRVVFSGHQTMLTRGRN